MLILREKKWNILYLEIILLFSLLLSLIPFSEESVLFISSCSSILSIIVTHFLLQ